MASASSMAFCAAWTLSGKPFAWMSASYSGQSPISMVCIAVPAGRRSPNAASAMRLNDALRRLPQKATNLIGSDIARFLPGYWRFVSAKARGYIEAAGRIGNAMPLRDITLDDIESLAVGAWVLGTGGGGS